MCVCVCVCVCEGRRKKEAGVHQYNYECKNILPPILGLQSILESTVYRLPTNGLLPLVDTSKHLQPIPAIVILLLGKKRGIYNIEDRYLE